MLLKDFVAAYNGDMLFSVRELFDNKEIIAISFKKGEESAIKEALLNRPVKYFRAETETVLIDSKRTPNVVIAVVMDAPLNNDPMTSTDGV